MPYDVKRDGVDWLVINKNTGHEKARHVPPNAEEKAREQVRLLEGIEHRWEPTHGA